MLPAAGYRELPPPPGTGGALTCLWVRVMAPDGEPTRVLPDACADLIWSSAGAPFVAGPDTGPVVASVPPGTVLVGARFAPGAGGPALGWPLADLRDARVALEDLRPDLGVLLAEQADPEQALARIGAVAASLVATGPPDPAIREAARRLADPRARVEALAGELGLSERQLRRRCHASVGYGPKALQRTLRFRRFVACADAAGPRPDLAWIAAECGYADQSHLTRECVALAGMTPAALARSRAR